MGILSVRIGCTGSGHYHTGLLACRNDALRAAIHGIKGDKISALRSGPFADAQSSQLFIQDLDYRFKLGTKDICMLSHMLHHAVNVLKETYMAQLIYLVVSDGLDLQLLFDIFQVILRSSQGCNTGTGEADLGCRSKLIYQIRISCALALCQNLNQMVLIMVIQMVYTVGVIPVNTEVLCCRL